MEDKFRALLDAEEEITGNPNTDVIRSFNLGEISQESKVLCQLLADSPYAVNEQFQDSMMTKWMELRERTTQTSPADDPIMEERESLNEAIQTICDKTLEALQQSFIFKPKRPLENSALKMIMKIPIRNNPTNDTFYYFPTINPIPPAAAVSLLLDHSLLASRALTEKALLIFLKHYYSLEWLEEYLFQEFFTSTNSSDFRDFLEKRRNLLLCVHLVHKTNPINPTAEFLFAFAFFLTERQPSINNRFDHETLLAKLRYQEYFIIKADEAVGKGSLRVANLWKKVAWSQTPLNRSLNYYAAKVEEAKIAGSLSEIAYWQQLSKENRQMEWTNALKPNSTVSTSPELGIVRNVIIFSEDQRNANYFIQNCRAKASFYRTMDNGNLELASLWEQTAVALSKNDRNALQTFRIAWCLEKMNDPNYRPVWPLWRILLHQIRTQYWSFDLSSSESPFVILEDIIKDIRNSNKLARHYQTKAEDEGSRSHISELYRIAASHFSDRGKYLTNFPSSFKGDVDEQQLGTSGMMMRATIRYFTESHKRTLTVNFEHHLTRAICDIMRIESIQICLQTVFNLDASEIFVSAFTLVNTMKQNRIDDFIELEKSLHQVWAGSLNSICIIPFNPTEAAFLLHMEILFTKFRQLIENSHDLQFEKILLCFRESLAYLQETLSKLIRKQFGSPPITEHAYLNTYLGDSIKSFTFITNKMLESGNDLHQFHKFLKDLNNFELHMSDLRDYSLGKAFECCYVAKSVIVEAFRTNDPKRHAELFSCSSALFSAAIYSMEAACSRLDPVRDLYIKARDILLKALKYSEGSYCLSSKVSIPFEMITISETFGAAAKLWKDCQEIQAKVKVQKAEFLLERAEENSPSHLISEERFKILMDFIDDPRMAQNEALESWKKIKELCARKSDHFLAASSSPTNQWDIMKLTVSKQWRIVEHKLFDTSCAVLNVLLANERGTLDNLVLIMKASKVILNDFEVQFEYAKKEENMPRKMKKENEFRLLKWKELESNLATLSSSHLHSLIRFEVSAFWEIQKQLSENLTVAKKAEEPLKCLEECLIGGSFPIKWFLAAEKFKSSVEKWFEAGEMESKIKNSDVAVHLKRSANKTLRDLEKEARQLFLEGQMLLVKTVRKPVFGSKQKLKNLLGREKGRKRLTNACA